MGIRNRGKYFRNKGGFFWKDLNQYPKASKLQRKTRMNHFQSPNNHDPVDLPEKQHYMDHELNAELKCYEWQLQNGREIFQSGVAPQDAFELQCLNAFLQEEQRIHGTAIPFDEATPETFDSHDEFHPSGSPTETMYNTQPPFGPLPDETGDIGNSILMQIKYEYEQMKDLECIPEQMNEPRPGLLQYFMENDMNRGELVFFDPMNPMSMLGRLPFEEI